jgi:hypothetical protein
MLDSDAIEKVIAEINEVADDIANEGMIVRASRVRKAAILLRQIRLVNGGLDYRSITGMNKNATK